MKVIFRAAAGCLALATSLAVAGCGHASKPVVRPATTTHPGQAPSTTAAPTPSATPTPALPVVPAALETFGTLYLPSLAKLGHPGKAPLMQFSDAAGNGKDVPAILNKGGVGHYNWTQWPWDPAGNFGLAAHRNWNCPPGSNSDAGGYCEPFRFINQLKQGDPVLVEIGDEYYIYVIDQQVPSTGAKDVSVVDPIPTSKGVKGDQNVRPYGDKPGRYITLTTCTPDFMVDPVHDTPYRLIVWGHFDHMVPKSAGTPPELAAM